MIRRRTTAPTGSPVTLDDLRSWFAFDPDITEDDSILEDVIDEVTAWLEGDGVDQGQLNGRKLLNQTWEVVLDAVELEDVIRIPLAPVASVTSIKTYDDDGAETTVSTSSYQVRTGEHARVSLTSSSTWPSDVRDFDAMVITVEAGYGSLPADVPVDFRTILRALAQHQYKSKGAGIVESPAGNLYSLPFQIKEMVAKKRLIT